MERSDLHCRIDLQRRPFSRRLRRHHLDGDSGSLVNTNVPQIGGTAHGAHTSPSIKAGGTIEVQQGAIDSRGPHGADQLTRLEDHHNRILIFGSGATDGARQGRSGDVARYRQHRLNYRAASDRWSQGRATSAPPQGAENWDAYLRNGATGSLSCSGGLQITSRRQDLKRTRELISPPPAYVTPARHLARMVINTEHLRVAGDRSSTTAA